MIHTWSLAVEEQFYLVFPGALLLLNRCRNKSRLIIFSISSISFLLLTIWLAPQYPNAVFYLLPFRVWEFGTGIVVYSLCRIIKRKKLTKLLTLNLFQLGCVVCYVLAGTFFSPSGKNLIISQVVVAVVTGFLLYVCQQDFNNRALLAKPLFAYLGVISYGAYLLHQPIISLLSYSSKSVPTTLQLISAIVGAFVGAWLLHRFIEQPIQRRYQSDQKSWTILITWSCISLVMVGGYLLCIGANVSAHKLTAQQNTVLAYTTGDNSQRLEWKKCFLASNDSPALFSQICKGTERSSRVLMYGDSHSAMIASTLARDLPSLIRYSMAGCAPVLSKEGVTRGCHEENVFVLHQIAQLHPRVIVIANNWLGEGLNGTLTESFVKKFEFVLRSIKRVSPSSQILILGNSPQWLPNLPIVLVRDGVSLVGEKRIYDPELPLLKRSDSQLEQVAKNTGSHFVSFLPQLCRGTLCIAVSTIAGTSEPFVFDSDHTSAVGRQILANETSSVIHGFM